MKRVQFVLLGFIVGVAISLGVPKAYASSASSNEGSMPSTGQLMAPPEPASDSSYFRLNSFKDAAIETTLSPAFYIPTIIGAIAYFDSAGARVSKSARFHQPFWGDLESASQAADNLRTATSISMVASSLLFVPKGPGFVFTNIAFDALTSFTAVQVRGLVRDSNRRPRPNGSTGSFPSGHATAAGSRVALSNYNIFNSDLNLMTKYVLAGANWTLAYLVAYARIESHNHYPEDVLAGVALGYWTSLVMKKTLTSTYLPKASELSLQSSEDGAGLVFNFRMPL